MRVEPSVAKMFAEVLRTLLQTDKAQQTENCYKNKQKIRLNMKIRQFGISLGNFGWDFVQKTYRDTFLSLQYYEIQ